MCDRSKVQGALERVRTPVILCHTTVSAHPSYIFPYTTWGLRSGESVCVYVYVHTSIRACIHQHIHQEDKRGRAATNSFPRFTLAYANPEFKHMVGIGHLSDKIIREMELGSFFGPATGLIEQATFISFVCV